MERNSTGDYMSRFEEVKKARENEFLKAKLEAFLTGGVLLTVTPGKQYEVIPVNPPKK